jgi:hypothetical protein
MIGQGLLLIERQVRELKPALLDEGGLLPAAVRYERGVKEEVPKLAAKAADLEFGELCERLVHLALRDNTKVRTQSVGVEPNRRIVILPAAQVSD